MDVEMRKEAFGRERADSGSRSSRTKSALALFSRSPRWATSVGRRYGDGPLGGPGAQGPPDCSPEGGIPSPLLNGGSELLGGVTRSSFQAKRQSRLREDQFRRQERSPIRGRRVGRLRCDATQGFFQDEHSSALRVISANKGEA